MGPAAAGKRADSGSFPARKPPRAVPSAARSTGSRGAEAVEPHNLIPIRHAPRVLLTRPTRAQTRRGPALNHLAVLLEPGRGPGRVLHLEDHLDPTRERFRTPPRVEYNLYYITGRVALGQLGQRGVYRVVRITGSSAFTVTSSNGRAQTGFRFRRLLNIPGILMLLLFRRRFDDVFNALGTPPATRTGYEILRGGMVHVVKCSGFALQGFDPPACHDRISFAWFLKLCFSGWLSFRLSSWVSFFGFFQSRYWKKHGAMSLNGLFLCLNVGGLK